MLNEQKMRTALILALAIASLCSCERRSKDATLTTSALEGADLKKPMIRTISFNGSNGNFGVELNGDRAFLRQDSIVPKRIEMSYRHGLKLLEEFYAIPGIEEYRGKESDDRETSIQYLVDIYDEMPEYYSDEWVDYIIPKDTVAHHPQLNAWFQNMRTAKKLSDESAASLKRLAELSKQSESITKETSEREVTSILGEPQYKGTGGRRLGYSKKKMWNYLNYTDDSLHRRFNVWFDPKTGCSVSKVEILRSEIKKSPLLVHDGKVLQVYPFDPKKEGDGFLCHVRFNRDGRDFTIMVGVAKLDRVKGTPEIGAAIRMEHHANKFNFIFKDVAALYLESIVFTANGEQDAARQNKKK